MSLYERYKAGEYEEVWSQIRAISNRECLASDDIVDVAKETMERVAKNADLIAGRLQAAGWRALSADAIDLRTAPSPDDRAIMDLVRDTIDAPLPLSMEMFWRVVGGINWVWDYEQRTPRPSLNVEAPLDELDPLCIYPPEAAAYAIDEWMDEEYPEMSGLPDGQFRLDLAPDDLHKANISGGDPYGIILPSENPDPVFMHGSRQSHLVDYLRHCFKWAGFPGLEEYESRADVQSFLREFGNGIEPF